MSDDDKIDTRYHYYFIHNVFAHFFKDTLDYFSEYLYPRFKYRVVSTYDKAVEYLNKKEQYGRETDRTAVPTIILNPTGEFNISEDGGKQLWRFPNLAPGMLKLVFEPIYQDSNNLVTVGFSRIKGEIEVITLLGSFYEYCDLRMYLLQIFGGMDRPIFPRWFNSFIVLPDELFNFRYTNEYTGENYRLNWETAGQSETLVRTTNRTEYIYPCTIKPLFKLTGISDGSTRYGGADKLADWRLTFNMEYQVEIPSYIILQSNYLAENIHLEIGYMSCFSSSEVFSKHAPVNRQIVHTHWDLGLDSTSSGQITLPDQADIVRREHATLKNRYYHVITKDQAESLTDYEIGIPEQITDKLKLFVFSKYGKLSYGDEYMIINDGNTLLIKKDKDLNIEGDILELYTYQFLGEES